MKEKAAKKALNKNLIHELAAKSMPGCSSFCVILS